MPPSPIIRLTPREWVVIGAIAAGGLALRIAMAQGALWLDEAWSAMHAHEAGTLLGVFLGINHDNNHHLNSLWMQAVGIDAPPVLQRALAIVSSTASIAVAAVLMRRHGLAASIIAATLFAVSPFFAHYGSEARGYAPMFLALLVLLLHTDRWLCGGERPTAALALWAGIGLLSQLTMVIALVAIAGWTFLTLLTRRSFRTALLETLRTFLPAAVVSVVIVGGVLLAARLNAGGMRFGRLDPFSYADQLEALSSVTGYTIGVPTPVLWPLIAAAGLVAAAAWLRRPLTPFYLLAMVAFPLAVALLQPANPGHARYYSLLAIALVLLLADLGARGFRADGWIRVAVLVVGAAIVAASLVEDARLIDNQRGDPGLTIRELRKRAPSGTTVFAERPSDVPILAIAAATARYRLAVTERPCPAPPFLFVDRYDAEPLPGPQRICGSDFEAIASRRARGMINFHWRLYARK